MSTEVYYRELMLAKSLYRSNWVLPLGTAYEKAFVSFTKTVDAQDATDKLLSEIAVIVASLCIGGGMGAIFGEAAVNQVAVAGVTKLAATKNLGRLGHAVNWAKTNAVASFLFGQAWSKASIKLTAGASSQFKSYLYKSPFSDNGVNPLSFQNAMDDFLERANISAIRILKSYQDDPNLSKKEVDEIAIELLNAPYIKDAPRASVIQNIEFTAKELELIFYMRLIMDSDFLCTDIPFTGRDGIGPVTTCSPNSIPESVQSNEYPLPKGVKRTAFSKKVNFYNTQKNYTYHKHVEYRRPGGVWFSDIMDRVNYLYKDVFGEKFEKHEFSRGEILRAEKTLVRVMDRYIDNPPKAMQMNQYH